MDKITLYQKNTKGKTRVWSIEVDHTFLHSTIIIEHGELGGKLQIVRTEISEGSNIGKSNEKDYMQQAEFDAQAEINLKLKSGYVLDIDDIREKDQSATIRKPMKALPYRAIPKPPSISYTLFELGIRQGQTIGLQRKLDGWRFRFVVDEDTINGYASSGDWHLPFPHIYKRIREWYGDRTRQIILDGEIYNHSLGFDEVDRACKFAKNKTRQDQLAPHQRALRDKMEFHLFDVESDQDYSTRLSIIQDLPDEICIKTVETFIVKADDAVIQHYMEKFLLDGYEGLIGRVLDSPYKNSKGKHMFKYKPLLDCEALTIGFEKSITGDTLGALICRLPTGEEFSANPIGSIGSDESKQEIWNNQSQYRNKYVTILFLNFTKDGIPRHPRAKCFRKGISKD